MTASRLWLTQLQKASFRGIPFEIRDAETVFGRRNVLHEYPLRDSAYSEDLGKKAREFTFNAYTIGSGCINDLRKIIKSIEESNEPGVLVHPVLGIMNVVPRECRAMHSNTDGGIEYLVLTFAEAGVNQYPTSEIDTQKNITDVAQTSIEAVKESFAEHYATEGFSDTLATRAQNTLLGASSSQGGNLVFQANSLKGILNTIVAKGAYTSDNATNYSAYRKTLSDFETSVPANIAVPADLATDIESAVTGLSSLFPDDSKKVTTAYTDLVNNFGAGLPSLEVTDSSTPNQVQMALNQNQLIDLAEIIALIQIILAVKDMEFESRDDAFALMFKLEELIEPKLLYLANFAYDQAYNALNDARVAMVLDIKTRSATLKTVKRILNYAPLPALVIAYQQYQDATQDADIIARNHIRNPLFVPANQSIEILV